MEQLRGQVAALTEGTRVHRRVGSPWRVGVLEGLLISEAVRVVYV